MKWLLLCAPNFLDPNEKTSATRSWELVKAIGEFTGAKNIQESPAQLTMNWAAPYTIGTVESYTVFRCEPDFTSPTLWRSTNSSAS